MRKCGEFDQLNQNFQKFDELSFFGRWLVQDHSRPGQLRQFDQRHRPDAALRGYVFLRDGVVGNGTMQPGFRARLTNGRSKISS